LTERQNTMKMGLMNLDRRLIRRVAWVRGLYFLTVAAGFCAGIGAVVQARQLAQIINCVFLAGQGLAQLLPALEILLVVILARAGLGFLSEMAAAAAALRVKENLRGMLVEHLLALGPAFVQGERSGELINTVSQGIEALDAYFSQYLPQLALSGTLPLAYLFIVLPVDPLSAGILLVTGPLIPLFLFLIGHNAEALTRRQWNALGRMSAYFLDTLQGLAVLKALGRSKDQAQRIGQVSERYRQTTMQVLRVTFLSALALELLGTMGTAIIAVQIGLRLLYGQIGFELAFFVLLLAPDFYLPLRTLGLRFHASMAGVSAARRIFTLLEQPLPPVEIGDGKIESVSLRGAFEITFEDVSYTYPERSEPALLGVSMCIRSGETVALVGPSGAGKSTLAQLLLCFMQPGRGQIKVNGRSLARLEPAGWREQIAWVPQRPAIFQGSIADNLRLARPSATVEDLRRAAGQAHLLEVIDTLADGLDTQVGEGGSRLSSGQAQRLALARAFLRDAPVLVLDEPTAHLDVELEQQLQETTRRLCQGKTVLIIAHRLPTVLHASQVIVLEKGVVVESGSPQVLLAAQGVFARMVAAYSGADEALG
jgi:ATP-binding cassette, subfamily C, bacterial CydD